MASCHIPVFLDKSVSRKHAGNEYIDGSFWQFVAGQPEKFPARDTHKSVFYVNFADDEKFQSTLKDSSIVKVRL